MKATFSGMLNGVDWQIVTAVSDGRIAFIFRVKEKRCLSLKVKNPVSPYIILPSSVVF